MRTLLTGCHLTNLTALTVLNLTTFSRFTSARTQSGDSFATLMLRPNGQGSYTLKLSPAISTDRAGQLTSGPAAAPENPGKEVKSK